MADDPVTKDAWFSGFAAGEGSFILAKRQVGALAPCFVIGLRADDLSVLETLKKGFGGVICMAPARGRNRPVAYWTVSSKRELMGLVEYFDRFSLRAKKERDYTIWRRAVRVYCAGGQRSPELWPLREALIAGRKYEASDLEIEMPLEPPQLRLVA